MNRTTGCGCVLSDQGRRDALRRRHRTAGMADALSTDGEWVYLDYGVQQLLVPQSTYAKQRALYKYLPVTALSEQAVLLQCASGTTVHEIKDFNKVTKCYYCDKPGSRPWSPPLTESVGGIVAIGIVAFATWYLFIR